MTSIKISVDRLQIGNYIKLPLNWKEHPFLFSSFQIKSQEQIDLIRRLGLKQVIIFPEKSSAPPKPPQAKDNNDIKTPDPTLASIEANLAAEKERRIEQLKQYRRSLQRSEKAFERSMTQLRNLMSKLQTRPLTALSEAKELVDGIVAQLLSAEDMVLHLMSDAPDGENIYYHSLNVSILSMMLAKEAGFSEEEMKQLGFASLLHDIGVLRVPSPILRKTDPLTKAETNLFRQHPRYSVDLLELTKDCPDVIKNIVLSHHERLDGSGYPDGKKAEQIDRLVQIISVIDEYDSLCNPMPNSKPKVPHAVLSFMFKNRTKQLNKDYIGLLIKQLGIYPPGSVVQLSNGQVGLVMSVNSKRLLFPSVMVYDPSIPRQEAPVIDLEDAGLTIGKVISPTRLPTAVFEYLNPRVRISFYFDHSKMNSSH
jgi:HD-GYP domain-containing protein (c-di-GMP phosphodiesterase class II)